MLAVIVLEMDAVSRPANFQCFLRTRTRRTFDLREDPLKKNESIVCPGHRLVQGAKMEMIRGCKCDGKNIKESLDANNQCTRKGGENKGS